MRAGRRCDAVKVVGSGVSASERRPLVGRTEWNATADDGAARADRGVTIQGTGREKSLCLCKGRLKCVRSICRGAGGQRWERNLQVCKIIDSTGSEWAGED